uniref:Uncharacterized protein n=1 Tax=Anguilla anguilla TaxID=7936 RepID=A0A0E9UHZ7_ANGAN
MPYLFTVLNRCGSWGKSYRCFHRSTFDTSNLRSAILKFLLTVKSA